LNERATLTRISPPASWPIGSPAAAPRTCLAVCAPPGAAIRHAAMTSAASCANRFCVEWTCTMHLLLRNRELDDLAGPRDRFVRRVRQLQLDGVRTRLQADEDDLFTARVDDRPRLAVHVVVQMSDPWRHAESRVPEHRQYPQVFG